MVISELALGLFTNLLYESFKNIPEYISDTSSKVYDKAIEEFSNKNYKLTGIQIDTFFHQENVEKAIEKYLKKPDKLDCSNILIHEFFELFSEEDFSREDADLILNSFFEIIDAEIEKEPELRDYLILNFVKRTDKTTQEINQGVQELSQDIKEISHNVQEIKEVINGGRENQDKKEPGIDFEKSLEKYLNKIIDEDGKNGISEVYTELSAKEILPVNLKFHDKESDRPKEFEVLELVEKEEKLIISGESGSGKTITLKWLNFIYATDYLEKKEGNIPLYVELNTYIEGSFYDYVKIKANRKGISEDILKTILKEKAIILIDGMDLLSYKNDFRPYDQISNFISTYSNCKFVISSRPGFFENFENIERDFKVSELEKLTTEKIQEFIDKYVPDRKLGNILKNKILNDEQLKSILTTPMMLYLSIEVAKERKNNIEELFPSNRSEMYEAFISGLFKHYEKKWGKIRFAERSQIETALTNLYFELQCRNEVSYKYYKAKKIVKDDDTLEKCFKLGLLVENGSEIGYGIHQSFQEYFAALKLKELFESEYDVSEAFSHPKWEEVVIFTSEMLDSDSIDEFIGLMLSKGELFLASKCVNKASDNTKEKLCALLADKMDSRYELEKINSIESLERIGNIGAGIIIESLKDGNSDVRKRAAETLGNIKSDTAIQPLINALKDEDSDVRVRAAQVLGNIKSDTVVQPLINALKDEDSGVRKRAAEALGKIKSDTAVQLLINTLKDEDSDVKVRAAEALENTNSEMAVQLLINTLKDEDSGVRWGAAEALGDIKSDTVIQPLINALKDEDSKVRWEAAGGLGNIKSDTAVQPLINALKDEDSDVRVRAAEALGNIKSEMAVQPLINALKDEDSDVRWSAAQALGDIKPNITIQLLINALKDEDSDVRVKAAQALGNIKSDTVVQPLINALKDEDSDVRVRAAEALGNIKSEMAVQLLINTLKDEDSGVRWGAAEALGDIKSDTAIQPLINALKDEDSKVRWEAARALGNIKSEIAVQPLISLLKDEESYVRWGVAEALGDIKSDTAIQPLINALKDEDSDVRWIAAEALGKIKSEMAVQPLINLLKDEDSNVRVRAAEALGNIKSEIAVQPLISLLKDEESYVRWGAAEALGKIKSDTAIQPLLRWSAVEVLGNIKSDAIVQPLINAPKDEVLYVRWNEVEALGNIKKALGNIKKALGNIKSDAIVQPLINLLKDEDSKVRVRAAKALGNIKLDTAVQPLINALKDEDKDVRRSAAWALGTICTIKNKKQLEDLLESDHEFSANIAFKILYEIEKEEKSKVVLFKDEKFLKT
jgi:FOG: HEAT repeat